MSFLTAIAAGWVLGGDVSKVPLITFTLSLTLLLLAQTGDYGSKSRVS